MVNFDIETFLIKGQVFGFNNETTEKDVVDEIGNTYEIEDYGDNGKYLHYDNLRFSFFNGQLNGVDLFLMNSDKSYICNVLNEAFSINKKTSLLRLIHFINLLELKWKIQYEKSTLDYLLLEIISSGINVFYYFEKEQIERISLFVS